MSVLMFHMSVLMFRSQSHLLNVLKGDRTAVPPSSQPTACHTSPRWSMDESRFVGVALAADTTRHYSRGCSGSGDSAPRLPVDRVRRTALRLMPGVLHIAFAAQVSCVGFVPRSFRQRWERPAFYQIVQTDLRQPCAVAISRLDIVD